MINLTSNLINAACFFSQLSFPLVHDYVSHVQLISLMPPYLIRKLKTIVGFFIGGAG